MSGPQRLFVGLGSNLDDPPRRVLQALVALADSGAMRLVRSSRLWRSEPWGDSEQPDFVNAVAELASEASPDSLLASLKAIESDIGRQSSGRRWGPRRIDLDLLAVAGYETKGETLVLPHPEIARRRFVLGPWADIAPEFRLPDGRCIRQLLEDCDDPGGAEPLNPLNLVVPVDALRRAVAGYRAGGHSVALVPTMGNLHQGHLSLVARAAQLADRVVVSIFVNPTQFGPGEDFATYPRTLGADLEALLEAGCDLVWAPSVNDVYPGGLEVQTTVAVPVPAAGALCDGGRPGHFSGVANVVARLFGAVEPDVAVFGQKDLQQLRLIERMTRDLLMDVRIEAGPIVREASGLAMSSRNHYLDPTQREQAAAVSAALHWVADQIRGGQADFTALETAARRRLSEAGLAPEYVSVRSAEDLSPVQGEERHLAILAAARLGSTRLIDNVLIQR